MNAFTTGAKVGIMRALSKHGPMTIEQLSQAIRPRFKPRLHAALGDLEREGIISREAGFNVHTVYKMERQVRFMTRTVRECKADA